MYKKLNMSRWLSGLGNAFLIVVMLLSSVGLDLTSVSAAPAGTALQFNGSNQYVTFGPSAGLTTGLGVQVFTLELWFKRTGAGSATTTGTGGLSAAIPLITKGRGEGDNSNLDMNYFFGIDNATNRLVADFEECASGMGAPCAAGGSAGLNHPAFGGAAIQNNIWYHAAVTYDGQNWKFYLNGVQDGSTTTLPAVCYPRWDSIQHAGIGTAMTSTGVTAGFFAGATDEVRIWNVVRTQAEIQADMFNELTSGTGLIGRWGLNEGTGTSATNSIGGRPNGTLINGPTWVDGFPIPDTEPPAAPSGLNATPGNSVIGLSWTANSEPDIAGYNVYQATISGGPYTKLNSNLINVTNYTASGLTNGTPYYYVVTGVDTSTNESANSTEATGTPADTDASVLFDGTNDYVTFGQAAGLGARNFTLELWFKRSGAGITVTTGNGGVVGVPLIAKGRCEADGTTQDMNYFFGLNASGQLVADFEDTATGGNHPVTGVATVPSTDTSWHHASVTYDETTFTWKLYLDGNLDRTLTLTSLFTPQFNSIQHASIGTALDSTGAPNSSCSGTGGFFQGQIDEVRVWNIVRDQTEIQAGRAVEISSATGLIGRWGLDEGFGSTAFNSVGNIHGALTNGPQWVAGGFPIPDSTPPAAPTGLTASTLGETVNLAWDPNGESDLAGYNVYRSTSPSVPLTNPINGGTLVTGTSYADGARSIGVQYYYVVTALDTSTNESTASNEVFVTPSAGNGAALQFDGLNDHVTFGSNLNATNFTLEAWVKRDSGGATMSTGTDGLDGTNGRPLAYPILTKGMGQGESPANINMNWFLGITSTGVIGADFEDNAGGVNHPAWGTTAVPVGGWHHIAATYNGSCWSLYLDGNLETLNAGVTACPNATPEFNSIQHAALSAGIGSTGQLAAGFFAGTIDEARVWDVARTQAEIQNTINGELTGGSGLIGRWGMNEGSGTTIADSTAPAANGTPVNTPLWVAVLPLISRSRPRLPRQTHRQIH